MRAAIALAEESVRSGKGGPFGAVVVRNGIIVGQGSNRVTATNDPTAHAEILAIRQAGHHLGTFRLQDCEIYASCEPCPMCLSAIYWARLKKIYYGNTRHDAAGIGFDDDFIYAQVSLPPAKRALESEQCLREEAQAAFVEWKEKPDKIAY